MTLPFSKAMWSCAPLFKLALSTILLGCTPSSPIEIVRNDCGPVGVVSDTSVIAAYDRVFVETWGTERDKWLLLFQSCGEEILVFEDLPENVFGGTTYVYFDQKELKPNKVLAFQ